MHMFMAEPSTYDMFAFSKKNEYVDGWAINIWLHEYEKQIFTLVYSPESAAMTCIDVKKNIFNIFPFYKLQKQEQYSLSVWGIWAVTTLYPDLISV